MRAVVTSQQLQELIKTYRPRSLPSIRRGNRSILSLAIPLKPPAFYPRIHIKATKISKSYLLDIHIDAEKHGLSTGHHPFINQIILKIQT